MKQEVVTIPKGGCTVDVAEKPTRVWTLLEFPEDVASFVPHHHFNAFLEDYVHDWNWSGGVLRYFSRVGDPFKYETYLLCVWE